MQIEYECVWQDGKARLYLSFVGSDLFATRIEKGRREMDCKIGR
jgi:hypothetical protein